MDFGKLFKRQKSVKDKGKAQRSSANRNSQRSSTVTENSNAVPSRLNQRRPSNNTAAGPSVVSRDVNRWSRSSDDGRDTHRGREYPQSETNLPRAINNNQSAGAYLKRKSSSPALYSDTRNLHAHPLSHGNNFSLPRSPLADDRHYHSEDRLFGPDVANITALVELQNVEPPPYHDCIPPSSNSRSRDDLIHAVNHVQNDTDSSWDDSESSDEPNTAGVQNKVLTPRVDDPVQELPTPVEHKPDDDVVDGIRRFRFRSKKSRKEDRHSGDVSSSAEDNRVHVEFRLPTENRSGPRLKEAPPHLKHHQIQRRHIIETILNSECSYIESLERLDLQYRKALLDARPQIISPDIVDKIFYKIDEILQCHRLFQIALAAIVDDWDSHEEIGNTFVACFSKSMVLECYSKYINNFTTAMELVRRNRRQKPQFESFLQRKQAGGKDRLTLFGLMLKPIQRFPQFIMLVQDLLKNTPSNHVDSLPLQLALTELETLAGNLDRCRAESEEKADMVKLINSSNIRLTSPFTKGGHARRLLKKETLRELAYDENGAIEKDKDTFIVLTSDMLMSCSGPNRRQPGLSTFRDSYKLRWCTSLSDLDIEFHKDSTVSIEIAKINNDIATLKSIGEMIRKLNSSCPGLTLDAVNSSIHSLTVKADECSKSALQSGATSLTVSFPHKDDRRERRTLVMQNIHSRNEWRDSVTNAKLSIDLNNVSSWFTSSSLEPYNLWNPPLFLQSMDCEEQNETLQVQCIHTFVTSNHTTSVWLAFSSSAIAATVNIYDMHEQSLKKTRSMHVVSSVQCMECWSPFSNSLSVWLGMEGGSLHEYGTEFPHPRICQVTIPTMSTVMLLKAVENRLYVGLLDDSIAVYMRPEGSKGLERVQSIRVDGGQLICLSSFNNRLWATAGNDVITIDAKSFKIESARRIRTEKQQTVTHAVFVGSGLWVSFAEDCSLNLYHRDTMKNLQHLDLSTPIRDFLRDYGWHTSMRGSCSITSLWSACHHLMAGTSNGLILVMPLPKLPGSVPKTTGPCRICYHTLKSPICFVRTSNADSYEQAKQAGLDANKLEATDDKNQITSPGLMQTGSPSSNRHLSTNGQVSRKHSDTGSPKLSDRRSRLGSVFSNSEFSQKDDFDHDGLAARRSSLSQQLLTQGLQTAGNTFPLMIACGDGYKYVKSQSSNNATYEQSTVILLWKMVL